MYIQADNLSRGVTDHDSSLYSMATQEGSGDHGSYDDGYCVMTRIIVVFIYFVNIKICYVI
jgi:hypothetical protein